MLYVTLFFIHVYLYIKLEYYEYEILSLKIPSDVQMSASYLQLCQYHISPPVF